jgi:hypothetical protein
MQLTTTLTDSTRRQQDFLLDQIANGGYKTKPNRTFEKSQRHTSHLDSTKMESQFVPPRIPLL